MLKAFLFTIAFIPSIFLNAQEVESIKYSALEKIIQESNQELTVVNFWATWCGPCIKEMPYFDALDKEKNVKVYFVSLDFEQEIPKIKTLLEKKSIEAKVFWLDETDYDSYMRKVSDEWSGAIPATLMIDGNGKRYFYEKAFTSEQLESTVIEIINSI